MGLIKTVKMHERFDFMSGSLYWQNKKREKGKIRRNRQKHTRNNIMRSRNVMHQETFIKEAKIILEELVSEKLCLLFYTNSKKSSLWWQNTTKTQSNWGFISCRSERLSVVTTSIDWPHQNLTVEAFGTLPLLERP